MRTCGWCLELSVFFLVSLRLLPRLTVLLPALPDVHLSAQREVHVQTPVLLQLGERGHIRLRHTPHIWALGLSCETSAVSGPPGLHTTTRELQTCTFERTGASNTTKIPRKRSKEGEKSKKLWREREEKRKFWATPPFEAPPLGPTLRGPTFSRFGPPTHRGSTLLGSTLLGGAAEGVEPRWVKH